MSKVKVLFTITKSDASNERFIVQFIPRKCNKDGFCKTPSTFYYAESQEFLEPLQLVVLPLHRTSYIKYTRLYLREINDCLYALLTNLLNEWWERAGRIVEG